MMLEEINQTKPHKNGVFWASGTRCPGTFAPSPSPGGDLIAYPGTQPRWGGGVGLIKVQIGQEPFQLEFIIWSGLFSECPTLPWGRGIATIA